MRKVWSTDALVNQYFSKLTNLYFDYLVIGRQDFCTHASHFTFFVCFLSYFIPAVPMRKMFGKALVHEFLISYIAILNTTFFRAVSAIQQILLN